MQFKKITSLLHGISWLATADDWPAANEIACSTIK